MRLQSSRSVRAAAAAVLLAGLAACAGVLFTAPPGSTITLIANPPFVASDGGAPGTSVITAIITEPAGTPVSDGTVMLCFSDIGAVDRQGKTNAGLARVNFVSDSRSGVATVTCTSGGPAPTVSTNPSPDPSAPPVTGGGSGTGSATVQITVGNARVKSIILTADPPRITVSNSTHVFARVLDSNGNPIPNVPVTFQVVDNPQTEFFDVRGPVFTNNNGEAEDVMRTRRETPGNAQVRAVAPGPGALVTSDPLVIAIQ